MKTTATYRYPDLKELEAYTLGTLDPGRAHEIEALALDDPLLAEAIEGYEQVPAFAEATQLTPAASSSGTPWWHMAGWGAGLLAGGLLAIAVYTFNRKDDTIPVPENQPATAALSDARPETIREEVVEAPSVTSPADAPDPTPTPLVTQGQVSDRPLLSTPSDRTDRPEIKVIERTNAGPVLLDVKTQDPALKQSSFSDGANLLHWRNYKLIDYSEVRKKMWPDFDQPSHTPANQENQGDQADMLRTETIQSIPYIEYLDKCIDAFRNGEFRNAAAHFDVILAQYPDDLNGQFYGAMSHYHLGEYERAVVLFDQSLRNVFKTFREESEFYKAMSLSKLNRTSEAKELFTRIAAGNGFYAQRAAQELK